MPFTVWATGQTVTAADFNTMVQQQVVSTWASTAARDAGIATPSHGMFAFTEDQNKLWYYDSSSWVETSLAADITAVNTQSNSSMAGGAASGAINLTVDVNNTTTATATATDYVLISDVDDSNATKKALVSDITALATGDITSVQTNSNSGLSGGVTTGDAVLAIDANNLTSVTGTGSDYIVIEDATDNTTKKCLASDIASDPIPLILALS